MYSNNRTIRRRQSRGACGSAILGLAFCAVFVSILAAGCDRPPPAPTTNPSPTATPPRGEGLAIYLTDPEIPPGKLAMLSHLELADEPILSQDDIVSYVWDTHEITLVPAAVERLQALKVPTSGKSFAVCVDGAPVYAGAFWAGYSSQSFDGVVIDPILVTLERPVIRIELGYPGASFFSGADPRSARTIRAALEAAGKLK